MENEEIKQYLIQFVENTLNDCEAFSKVYDKEFVKKQLAANLDKVISDIYVKGNCRGMYNPKVKAIILFSEKEDSPPLTISDIENDETLKHNTLHEAIHAIFRKNEKQCKELGLKFGTGTDEMYPDGTGLGRGLNEGLTEWICQKAGYKCTTYMTVNNIVRMLELAIGEENIMKLANGDIKGNVTQLLGLDETECRYVLGLIDKIHDNEIKAYSIEDGKDNTKELEVLDKSVAHFEATIFEKYFGKEIEEAINSDTISNETMMRMFDIQMMIQGGKTSASDVFASRLPMRFKNEIYLEIFEKSRETKLKEIRERVNKHIESKTKLPTVYKKNWFQKIKESIKKVFTKEHSQNAIIAQEKNAKEQNFKEYISEMSNFSGQPAIRIEKTNEEQKEVESHDEYDL